MIVNHEKKFIYISIPKVGSTTLHRFLTNKIEGSLVEWDLIGLKSKNKQIDFNNYYSFAFVRNPWSRLYSCWKDKCFIDDKYLENAPFFKKHKNISFEKFVDVVESQIKENPWCDPHIRPMNILIEQNTGYLDINKIDFTGKLESLESDVNNVLSKLNIKQTFSNFVLNKSKEHKTTQSEAFTSNLVDRVSEIYGDDINSFNYSYK